MAKLKSEKFWWKYEDRETALAFSVDIQVSADGTFYTYFPDNVVEALKKSNIDIFKNPCRRNGKSGYIDSSTLPELISNINAIGKDYTSRKLVSKKIVIRYIIESVCAYMIEDENFIPNGSMLKGEYTGQWKNGTKEIHAADPEPFGFRLWTEVAEKKVYTYASGVNKEEYDNMTFNDKDKNRPMLTWLCGVVSNAKPENGNMQEIDYTEDVAEFFVSTYKTIFAINEAIMKVTKPEQILKLIESGQKLIN